MALTLLNVNTVAHVWLEFELVAAETDDNRDSLMMTVGTRYVAPPFTIQGFSTGSPGTTSGP